MLRDALSLYLYIVLHAVSSLLCRYDDDQIPGGDKERYAR